MDWPFEDPPNTTGITLRQIIRENAPILLVTHDADDGCWQFLSGGDFEADDGLMVSLGSMLDRDPTLAELSDLPPGGRAWRKRPDVPWQRGNEA